YFGNMRTREGLEKSVQYFQQAVQIDPRFALAYTGIADVHTILVDYGWSSPADAIPKARAALDQALVFDANLGETYASLGLFDYLLAWDQNGAERAFHRALTLKPSLMTAHQWYGGFLMRAGRFDEAIREAEKARQLDPVSLPAVLFVGWVHY